MVAEIIAEIITWVCTFFVLIAYTPILMLIVFSLLFIIVLIVFILLKMFVMSKYDDEGGEGEIW